MNDSELLVNVASNVQLERKALGLSVAQLAKSADVSASYLYSVEAKQTNPGLLELEKLSAALGRSVLQLLAAPTLEECEHCHGSGYVRREG